MPGQATREMDRDEAQVLDRTLKAVMEKGPELHLPSAYVQLMLVAQGERGLQTQDGEGDARKMMCKWIQNTKDSNTESTNGFFRFGCISLMFY